MVESGRKAGQRIKVGLVGCGRISKAHVRALADVPDVEVRGVCDKDRDRAAEIAGLAGGAATYDDLTAMIENEKLDTVHILTPPSTHAALAMRAMEAGCHVFVEKPMAMTVCEADEIIAVARKTGAKLGVGHNYLFKPSVQKALEAVRSGAIGDMVYIHTYYGLAAETGAYATAAGRAQSAWRWKLRGGVFADFLPHLVYLQLALVDRIEHIAAVTVLPAPSASQEPTEMGIQYEGGGVLGQMTISMRAKPYAKYMEVYGTKGIVHADLARELCTVQVDRRMPGALSKMAYSLEKSAQLALGTAGTAARVAVGRMKAMPEMPVMLREFYASIRNGIPVPVSAEQGRQVTAITEEILARLPEPEAFSRTRSPATRDSQPATRAEEEFARTANVPTVFVTGGTGFLGQRLIEALHRSGARVVALVRDDTRVPVSLAGKAEFVRGDVRDPDAVAAAMRDASLVFHTAAVTTNAVAWQVHHDTNVLGTKNVLEAAARTGVAHAVHVSSVAVYGLADRHTAVNEMEPLPSSIDRWAYYMRTKIEAEEVATQVAAEHGLGLSILRLGMLYGPGAAKPVGRGLLQLGALRFTIGAGRNHLPYTYVDNAVDCMLLAALRALPGVEAYNVVDAPAVSVREAAIEDGRLRSEKVTLIPVPSFLLSTAAALAEFKNRNGSTAPKLSRYAVRSATRNVIYDTDKVRSRLGWQPAVSFAEGLRRTQTWRA